MTIDRTHLEKKNKIVRGKRIVENFRGCDRAPSKRKFVFELRKKLKLIFPHS